MGTHRAAILIGVLALAVAACTSDEGSGDPAPTTSAPVPARSQPPSTTTTAPLSPPTTQPPSSGTLTATLQVDGSPLAGVEVFLGVTPAGAASETRYACTDAEGVVKFTDVRFDAALIAITGPGTVGECPNPLFLDTSTSPAYPLVTTTLLPANSSMSADRDLGVVSVARLPGSAAIARESVASYVGCLRDGDVDEARRHFDRYERLVAAARFQGEMTDRDNVLIDANTDGLRFALDAPDPCADTAPIAQVPVLFEWTYTADTDRPKVTLIDPGSEPRRVLTFTPEPGTTQPTTLRQMFTQTQEIDGEPASATTTTLDVALTAEVVAVVEEGFIIVSTPRASRVRSTDDAAQNAVAAALQNQHGMSEASLVAPSGEVLAVETSPGSFGDLLAGTVSPLPAEPVGVGAVWMVEVELDALGFNTIATTTYTITAIDGSLVALELEAVHDVDISALVHNPALADAEVTITQSSTGTAVWDLSTNLPTESSVEVEQVLIVTGTVDGDEGSLEQVTITSVEIPSPGAFAPPDGTMAFVVADATHVAGEVDYEQDPPVGGPHASEWEPCGYYGEPISTEMAVHSLEHGAVWITYDADLPADQVAVLEDLAATPYVLVSPYPGLDSPVVASAWGAQLHLDSAADPRLAQFIDWFASGPQTPEPGAPC